MIFSKPSAMLFAFLSASLFAVSLHAQSVSLDKIIAVVDDDIVMQSELTRRVRAINSRLKSQGTPLPSQEVMHDRVLDQLILENIQMQLAERAGIRIGDTQLNATIDTITKSNNMTLAQFEAQLKAEGETYANAREQIRTEMIISRVQKQEVDRRVRVTELEIENFLTSKEGRTQSGTEYYLGHILVSVPDSASLKEIEAGEKKANNILVALKAGEDFKKMAVEKSDGRQALNGGVIGWRKEGELPSIAANIIPTLKVGEPSNLVRTSSGFHIIMVLEKRGGQEQLIDQAHVRHILIAPSEIRSDQQAKTMIDKLYERISSGDDFAELAKSNSDDPVSAIDGGSLDWVSPGQMVPEFDNMMDEVALGEVSKPFRSQFGWHILEIMERRKQDMGALILANQAKQVIHNYKYESELSNWLLEIKSEAFIEIKGQTTKIGSNEKTVTPKTKQKKTKIND
jgi:peptidyl-prolyl cis-trans isomerase SurA